MIGENKMKKIIAIILVVTFVFTLSACNNKNTVSDTDTSAPISTSSESFIKPENYASVLLVSINPQFKLYLDENNKVLAVEPVNDDAKSFSDSIDFENKTVEAVVGNIVEKANEKGFIKENVNVNFEITEEKDGIDNSDILAKVVSTVNQKASELNIEIKTEIKESDKSQTSDTNSENTQTNENSKPTTTHKPTESSKPVESSKPTHTHSYSDATCTAPAKCSCGATKGSALGHKWQDATCESPKTCSVCKTTEGGTIQHFFDDEGKCVWCKQILPIAPENIKSREYNIYKPSVENFVLNFASSIAGYGEYAPCEFVHGTAECDKDVYIHYNGNGYHCVIGSGPIPFTSKKIGNHIVVSKFERYKDMVLTLEVLSNDTLRVVSVSGSTPLELVVGDIFE